MNRYFFAFIFSLFFMSGCATQTSHDSLYSELGEKAGITKLVEGYITEISYRPELAKHFVNTNFTRLRDKLVEQICEISGGPCTYSGDNMIKVHTGMHINESEFNQGVDALIVVMGREGVATTTQNKLLARLATLRGDIIDR